MPKELLVDFSNTLPQVCFIVFSNLFKVDCKIAELYKTR